MQQRQITRLVDALSQTFVPHGYDIMATLPGGLSFGISVSVTLNNNECAFIIQLFLRNAADICRMYRTIPQKWG